MRRSPSETWMFSVVFWILCSWLPCLADWQVIVVPYTWSSCSNTSVTKTTVEHEWQSTFSPKRTWGSEQNFLRRDEYRRPDSQVLCFAWQHLVYQAGNLEFNSSSDRQPMKLTQYRCDVFTTFRSCDQPCHSILHRLYLPHEFVGHSVQQRVAVVQATWNERLY